MIRTNKLLFLLVCMGLSVGLHADNYVETESVNREKSGLSVGGYGEAVMSRNFYSNRYLRYTDAETYKSDDSHGKFDLPHVVLWLGYDFGKGWSLGTELEIEHGGVESAVEIEEEEGGEYEKEIERGGEVALEQFWLNKAWAEGKINLKMGHIIVPVGATNQYHMPTEFFTNYRPEGESTILPCTWHETGISLWGKIGLWRYELLFLSGLDSDRFSRQGWVSTGAGSPYEFKIANSYATAFRVDSWHIPNMRISASGYIGNSFKNTLSATSSKKYKDVKGRVMIGAIDFCYSTNALVIRGNADYGHLTDSEMITKYNISMRKDSPSPKQPIGSDAVAIGCEMGYDILHLCNLKQESKAYIFGRYEYYDSMFRTEGTIQDYKWCGRQRIAAGFNYKPINQIVIKGEYSLGILSHEYNNEPSISLGIAYVGLFK